jgi:hypothetical protein
MDLYAVDGAAVFGYDANDNADVNNGANLATLLASNTLVSGSLAGTPFVTALSADSLSTFTPTVAGTPVFLSPQTLGSPRIFLSPDFRHRPRDRRRLYAHWRRRHFRLRHPRTFVAPAAGCLARHPPCPAQALIDPSMTGDV